LRVLVLGGGGREHAIVRALRRSPQQPEVFCSPGNAGIARDAPPLEPADADLVLVGPEAPLVEGFADRCPVPCFGPSAAAARLEGSKAYAKEVMAAAGVPTASHTVVGGVEEGMAAIARYPVVLKADGLAAGKGVVIAPDEAVARAALEDMLVAQRFGEMPVVVEEHMEGPELSLLALCDGERAFPLAPAQDFKRIHDGDEGPNTGGMGSYSPVPGCGDPAELAALVHQPLVEELRRRGTPFHGVLYAGLMLTAEGPRVIEYNARFGDPETQAVLPRLDGDLLDLLRRAATPGGLQGATLRFGDDAAVTVVLASAGYPASSSSGDVISGIDDVGADIEVTHAGTARREDGAIVTAGGRVLNVTALGADIAAARDAAYAAADLITFEGRQLRRDIALRAVGRT
jgi:phosphoribosylamine---glycine ligase